MNCRVSGIVENLKDLRSRERRLEEHPVSSIICFAVTSTDTAEVIKDQLCAEVKQRTRRTHPESPLEKRTVIPLDPSWLNKLQTVFA
jgi:hypothetical protein